MSNTRVWWDAHSGRNGKWAAYCPACGQTVARRRKENSARQAALRHDVRKHPDKL